MRSFGQGFVVELVQDQILNADRTAIVSLAGIELYRTRVRIHAGPDGEEDAYDDALSSFAIALRDVLNR